MTLEHVALGEHGTGVGCMGRTVPRVCSRCITVVERSQQFCGRCGVGKPAEGWSRVDGGEDPWLGREVVDGWRVVQRLGSGSSGTVYRVIADGFERALALKIIDLDHPGHRSRDENLSRVRREVSIVSRLENPYVVAIYELERLDERHVAILMDCVHGPTLRGLVETEGPLVAQRALGLTRQLANGLHGAHLAGLIHRDIKPDNLLIEKLPSGEDFVRVTDFGLASPAHSASEGEGFAGTPLWASPEQILEQPLDMRSDIYSIGATLFFMLTGQPPFAAPDAETVLRAHIREPAPRLSDRATGPYSPALERLVNRLLSKTPERRPSDLLELIELLDTTDDRDRVSRELTAVEPSALILAEESETVETAPAGESGQSANVDAAVDAVSKPKPPTERPLDALVAPQVFELGLGSVGPTCLALNETCLVAGDAEGSLRRVESTGEETVLLREPDGGAITATAIDGSGRIIFAGNARGAIHMTQGDWTEGWERVSVGSPVTGLAISEDGQLFAVARRGEGVELFGRNEEEPIASFDIDDVEQLALSADGHLLAVQTDDGGIAVWAIGTGRRLYEIDHAGGDVLALRFAQATLLAVCHVDDRIQVIDLQSQHERRRRTA